MESKPPGRKRVVRVKAWAVVDKRGPEIIDGLDINPKAPESIKRMIYPLATFKRKEDALARRAWLAYPVYYKVVPVEISFKVPTPSKKVKPAK